jgi:D-beta-D-heptose 7-phosphate kinase/D-beta-D-heptose 1-phosphate adenosyltransferase
LNNIVSNTQELWRAVDRFSSARLMVVGDLMVDKFIWGSVERISPEAPVPVVLVNRESMVLGGAANVLSNVVDLGGRGLVAGVAGDDAAGRTLLDRLAVLGCPTEGVAVEPGRTTTIKTRIVAHSQQVVRLDREQKDGVGPAIVEQTLAYVEGLLQDIDGVVVADYGKGFVTRELMDGLRRLVGPWGVFLGVDPKVDNFELYSNVSFLTPNHHEAGKMYGRKITDEESLQEVGEGLVEHLGLDFILITRGDRGMSLFLKGEEPAHIPTVAKEVFDVSGAGDTVIATLALGLAAGLSPFEAALLANVAAGVVVGMVGTATVSPARLKRAMEEVMSAKEKD